WYNRVADVQLKIPMRFNHHFMCNLSQKRDVSDKNDSREDNRVADVDEMEGLGIRFMMRLLRIAPLEVNMNDKRT
ncbi:hypothetical protein Tco_0197897, partial [Tanacetum coccineum]